MSTLTTEQRVYDVIAIQMGTIAAILRPEQTLHDGLGVDSLDAVELVMALEDEFDIECISDDKAGDCKTVQDVVNLIVELTK